MTLRGKMKALLSVAGVFAAFRDGHFMSGALGKRQTPGLVFTNIIYKFKMTEIIETHLLAIEDSSGEEGGETEAGGARGHAHTSSIKIPSQCHAQSL